MPLLKRRLVVLAGTGLTVEVVVRLHQRRRDQAPAGASEWREMAAA
jgi:hypothetical protein